MYFLLGTWRKNFFIRFRAITLSEDIWDADKLFSEFILFWFRRFLKRYFNAFIITGALGFFSLVGLLFIDLTEDRQKITIVSPWIETVISISELTIDPLERRPDIEKPKTSDRLKKDPSSQLHTSQVAVAQTRQRQSNPEPSNRKPSSGSSHSERVSASDANRQPVKEKSSGQETMSSEKINNSEGKSGIDNEQSTLRGPRSSEKKITVSSSQSNTDTRRKTPSGQSAPSPRQDEQGDDTKKSGSKQPDNSEESSHPSKEKNDRKEKALADKNTANSLKKEDKKQVKNAQTSKQEVFPSSSEESASKPASQSTLHNSELTDEMNDAFEDMPETSETANKEGFQQGRNADYRYKKPVSKQKSSKPDEETSKDETIPENINTERTPANLNNRNADNDNQQSESIQNQPEEPEQKDTSPETSSSTSIPDDGKDHSKEHKNDTVKQVKDEPLSSFPVTTGSGSYDYMHRSLSENRSIYTDIIREEEFINYFPYDFPAPTDADKPIKTTVTVFSNPWSPDHKIMHIGIKGYERIDEEKPRANIVFIIDNSSSMTSANRLPLAQKALNMLVDELALDDTVAIATYGGSNNIILKPTPVRNKSTIIEKIKFLRPINSFRKYQDIDLAYNLAEQAFIDNGINHIVLVTSNDFQPDDTKLEKMRNLISLKRKRGISLSVFSFGKSDDRNTALQTIAQSGISTVTHLNTLSKARRKLMQEILPTTTTLIAENVKVRVEFNSETVQDYRLIGYKKHPFRIWKSGSDRIVSGGFLSGQTIAALYEILPAENPTGSYAHEYASLKIRYNIPGNKRNILDEIIVDSRNNNPSFASVPSEVRFSFAVAAFAEILKKESFSKIMTLDDVIKIAQEAKGNDRLGLRNEFIQLVRMAKTARRYTP